MLFQVKTNMKLIELQKYILHNNCHFFHTKCNILFNQIHNDYIANENWNAIHPIFAITYRTRCPSKRVRNLIRWSSYKSHRGTRYIFQKLTTIFYHFSKDGFILQYSCQCEYYRLAIYLELYFLPSLSFFIYM